MDDYTMLALKWEFVYRKNIEALTPGSNQLLSDQQNLDQDFEKFLDKSGIKDGTVLDIGTGSGIQAIFLAKRGMQVTATDISASAIKYAKEQAAIQMADVEFIVDNILSTNITKEFDFIIDRGCFTVIPKIYRKQYTLTLKKLLKRNGWFLLKINKNNEAKNFSDDPDFKIEIFEESDYKFIGEQNFPAIFLAMQKIK